MKKILTAITAIAVSAALTSCSFGGAGSSLAGALLGQNAGNASTIGNAVAGAGSAVAGALTSQNTLNNLLSSFLGKAPLNEETLHGSWTYQGVDVAFESESLLSKAGGIVAAGTIEEKLDEQLTKYGIKPGSVKFTFNADHTFSATLGGKPVNGTYTYDPATRKLNLVAAFGLFNQTCTVGTTAKGISLLFPADKLLSLVSTAGTLLGNSNSTLSTVSSLINNYKGMQIGLEMSK